MVAPRSAVLLPVLATIVHAAVSPDLCSDPFGLCDNGVPLDSPRTDQWRERLAQMQTGFQLLELLFLSASNSAAQIDFEQGLSGIRSSFEKLHADWASDLECQADAVVDLEKEGQVQITAAMCADALVQTRLSACTEPPLQAVVSLSESMQRTLSAAREAHNMALQNEVFLSTRLALIALEACEYAQTVCLQDSRGGYSLPGDWASTMSARVCEMRQLAAAYSSTVRHRIRTDTRAAVAEMCCLILARLMQAYAATPLLGLCGHTAVGNAGTVNPDKIAHGQEAGAPGQAVPARIIHDLGAEYSHVQH